MINKHTHSLSLFFTISVLIFFPISIANAESNLKKQDQLQKKINTASSSLTSSRAVSNKLKKYVRTAEDKLNTVSRELYKTEKEIKGLTKKLGRANKIKVKLLGDTSKQKTALAQQMQALYTSGQQSHLRLLLKQDDPSDISRTTKYFEYMNRHRLKRIHSIDKKINSIKHVEDQINTDTKRLQNLQTKQKKKKSILKSTVIKKEKALKKQRRVVLSKEHRLAKLVKQESRLKGVIERLARKQRREAENRKQARREARLAVKKDKKAKANKKAVAKNTSSKKKKTRKPKKRLSKTKPHFVPNKPFSSLRGKLSWPVRGSMLHRYGSKRNAKQRWKAVVISARGGTRVRAVARGKVEYSGRLKGYGYVIIIRHDKNYRSIYGYNRSVYKREGQVVKAGETIAAVGNSGGLSKTGLYFEIRKKTTHQNPARWCR